MNAHAILKKRRLWLPRKQCFLFLAIAAISVAGVQGEPLTRNNFPSRKFGQVFNSIKKSPRRHVAELQGGFSSLAEDDTPTAESSAGSQQKTDEGINQQIFSQSEEAMVTPTVRQSSSSTSTSITAKSGNSLGAWPCMDELDKSLIKISLPVITNFAIAPLVGTIDLFFINQMGNALAVAGQAAANQVFGSVFWLTSFLPSRKSAYPHYNCIGVSCTRFSNSTTN